MKKILALLLALCMIFALAACGQQAAPATTAAPTEEPAPADTPAPVEEPAPEENAVMSYADFVAAELEAPVVIEAYVQACESWWNDQINVHAADADGAYYIYKMACSEEDAAKLVPGQKIRVTGFKAEWAGEVEIAEGATFEFVEAEPYVAKPVNATEAWGTVDMIGYMNQLVTFKGVTIEPYDESGAAFAYKDPEGKTDDLYFKATLGDTTYEFCVEFYLCGKDTDVYKAVEALQVGDVVDLTGFLYWYNGPNLHTTALQPSAPDGVMSYADFMAAEKDDPVTVETYVQDHQSWWNDKITVYAQGPDGAYFLYELACSEEDAAKLVPGQKIRVTGYKSEWAGEIEIVDASFELIDGDSFIAEPVDVTELLGTDALAEHMNELVLFSNMTVLDYDGNGAAFAYKDPDGKTDDLYLKLGLDGEELNPVVEFYLRGKDSDVYKAVEALKVGDVVDVVGYLYWYNGANPHLISVTVK